MSLRQNDGLDFWRGMGSALIPSLLLWALILWIALGVR